MIVGKFEIAIIVGGVKPEEEKVGPWEDTAKQQTQKCVIVVERNKEFEIHWRPKVVYPDHAIRVKVYFYNKPVVDEIVCPRANEKQTISRGFHFGEQETTSSEKFANPHDQVASIIDIKFEWVLRCRKYISGNTEECIGCARARDNEGCQRDRHRSLSPFRPVDLKLGVVHESIKDAAHGITACARLADNLKDDDPEEGEYHGTYKIRTKFRYRYGPRYWLEDQQLIDRQPIDRQPIDRQPIDRQPPQNTRPAAPEVVDLCDDSEDFDVDFQRAIQASLNDHIRVAETSNIGGSHRRNERKLAEDEVERLTKELERAQAELAEIEAREQIGSPEL